MLNVKPSDLPGVLNIYPTVMHDNRGFFLETYSRARYKEIGIDYDFVQDNHSLSERNVLRGLHYQLKHPQGKLVRVVRGEVFDVAVDIRLGSPNFGKAACAILSARIKNQLWIPPGFAHGFCVLSDMAELEYKCTDFYDPDDEGCVLWDDPDLAITWPIAKPILSLKDQSALPLSQIPPNSLPFYNE